MKPLKSMAAVLAGCALLGLLAPYTPPRVGTPEPMAHAVFGAELDAVLRGFAPEQTLVVTTTNGQFSALFCNWATHLHKLGIAGDALVIALDAEARQAAVEHGLAVVQDRRFLAAESVDTWNTASFNRLVYAKTDHQLAILARGRALFFSDVDIPWTADWRRPIEAASVGEGGLDFMIQRNYPFGDLNVGFFFAAPTTPTLRLFREVQALEQAMLAGSIPDAPNALRERDDQTCFMWVLECGLPNATTSGETPRQFLDRRQKRYSKSWSKDERAQGFQRFDARCAAFGLRFGVLPADRFQTGHRKWGRKGLQRVLEDREIMYHANFLKGLGAKIRGLKERGRWHDECGTS